MGPSVQQLHAATSDVFSDGVQPSDSSQPPCFFYRRQYVLDITCLKSLIPIELPEAQVNTQEYGRRPYGVGFLVIGQDKIGPHLYEFSPSGNSYEYYAMSIGARSQSAKTYLEKHFESFADCVCHHSVTAC